MARTCGPLICVGRTLRTATCAVSAWPGTDLRAAQLDGARLDEKWERIKVLLVDRNGAGLVFRNMDLSEASLMGCDLNGADLRGANLRRTSLRGASLRGTLLAGADLTGTDLRGADLTDSELDAEWTAIVDLLVTRQGMGRRVHWL